MLSFSSQVAWTFATRVLMIFNSIAAGIIFARGLGAGGVGVLAVVNVAVAIVVQLGSFGLPSSNTYFIAQDQAHFRAAVINSLIFAFGVGSILALALGLMSMRPQGLFGPFLFEAFQIAAVSIPFQLITLIGLNILLAVGKIREFNVLDLAGQSFVLINAVLVLLVLKQDLLWLFTFNTIASILVSIVTVVLLVITAKSLTQSRWRADLALMRRMITYGLKFHVSILAGAIIIRADLLVVNYFHGADDAGIYSVASQFALLLMLLPGVIATMLFPRVTSEQDARGETTCMVTRYTTLIMFVCCLAAVPFSLLLPVIYGDDFAGATKLLLILLPGVYLMGLESVLVQHFNALGLPRAIPLYWVATLVLNLILVFALVPRLGAQGAAIASSISYATIFALVALHFRTSTGRSFSDVFVLGSLRG
jgi:stage V sporulation protein B